MLFFSSGPKSGTAVDRAFETETLPKLNLPQAVDALVREIDCSVKPGWFSRRLREEYSAAIGGILPIDEDQPRQIPPPPGGHAASPYLQLVLISFKDAFAAAELAPPDLSARLRSVLGWSGRHHPLAELAAAGVDFAHRLRRHGKFTDAHSIIMDASFIANEFKDPFLLAQCSYERGRTVAALGHNEQALGCFSSMLTALEPQIAANSDMRHWGLPRIPRVISQLIRHSLPQHDADARELLNRSYLLLKVLLESRRFTASYGCSQAIAPAELAVARAAAVLGNENECTRYISRACVSAGTNGDPSHMCETAIRSARIYADSGRWADGLRILQTCVDSIEPRLRRTPAGRCTDLNFVRAFGDVLDAGADHLFALGQPGAAWGFMQKRDELFRRFNLALPDDGDLPSPELV